MEENLAKKFREAIIDKLIEYEAYNDDELCQYIMVMVANKKSKESMENDLSLFLGKNTCKFTTWLHNMINKIESSPKDEAMIIEPVLSMVCVKTGPSNKEDDDDNVLALDSQETDDDLFSLELQEEAYSSALNTKKDTPFERTLKPLIKQEIKSEINEKKKSLPQKRFNCKSIVTSLKRPSAVLDEYDPMNPSVKSVANIVNASERKSSVPLSLQANKLLLFKAMADANKSVLGKNIDEMYKPTPIRTLNSIKEHTVSKYLTNQGPANHFTSENHDLARKRFAQESSNNLPIYNTEHECLSKETLRPGSEMKHFVEAFPTSEIEMRNAPIYTKPTFNEIYHNRSNSPKRASIQPHFVVTLDGVDFNLFKNKWDNDVNDMIDTDVLMNQQIEYNEDDAEEIDEETSTDLEKTSDKCRYWPFCKKGDSCIYHHPKIPCKSFPNCKFGNDCHFIHPECKFDSLCSRKDCPYTHKNKDIRRIQDPKLQMPYVSTFSQKTILCKYFPKCNSHHCPYNHPKKCRFGLMCKAPKCPFLHPSFPPRNQLKWKSELAV